MSGKSLMSASLCVARWSLAGLVTGPRNSCEAGRGGAARGQLTQRIIAAALTPTLPRSDRESRREMVQRMVASDTGDTDTSAPGGSSSSAETAEERLNMTVTCAEPSSPCRVAARGRT